MTQTTIIVNNKAVHAPKEDATGAEIKSWANVPSDYELFLVHEPGSGQHPDKQVPDSEVVHLRNGMKFRAIPPGNQG